MQAIERRGRPDTGKRQARIAEYEGQRHQERPCKGEKSNETVAASQATASFLREKAHNNEKRRQSHDKKTASMQLHKPRGGHPRKLPHHTQTHFASQHRDKPNDNQGNRHAHDRAGFAWTIRRNVPLVIRVVPRRHPVLPGILPQGAYAKQQTRARCKQAVQKGHHHNDKDGIVPECKSTRLGNYDNDLGEHIAKRARYHNASVIQSTCQSAPLHEAYAACKRTQNAGKRNGDSLDCAAGYRRQYQQRRKHHAHRARSAHARRIEHAVNRRSAPRQEAQQHEQHHNRHVVQDVARTDRLKRRPTAPNNLRAIKHVVDPREIQRQRHTEHQLVPCGNKRPARLQPPREGRLFFTARRRLSVPLLHMSHPFSRQPGYILPVPGASCSQHDFAKGTPKPQNKRLHASSRFHPALSREKN